MLDRKTIHVRDIMAAFDTEFPESKDRHQISGARTILATPLLRKGVSIGAIMTSKRGSSIFRQTDQAPRDLR
jgi:hypothetical protein